MNLISHFGVNGADLIVHLFVDCSLLLASDVLLHAPLESFHDGLSLVKVSTTSLRCCFLHAVVGEHLVICILLDCFSLVADFLSLCDDS